MTTTEARPVPWSAATVGGVQCRLYAPLDSFAEYRDAYTPSFECEEWIWGSETRDEALAGLEAGRMTDLTRRHLDRYRAALESDAITADTLGVTTRRRRVWSEAGDAPDVDRVLAQHDRPWRDSTRGREARTVRLGLNFCQSCGNTEEDFARLTALAAAAADTLAMAGYGVELTACAIGQDGSNDHRPGTGWNVITFPIKRAGEPLDVERVGSIGRPCVLRAWLSSRGAGSDSTGARGWIPGDSHCGEPPQAIVKAVGIDHLISRSWAGTTQRDLIAAVRKLIDDGDHTRDH